jgi:sugar lactone lactonase YvrE
MSLSRPRRRWTVCRRSSWSGRAGLAGLLAGLCTTGLGGGAVAAGEPAPKAPASAGSIVVANSLAGTITSYAGASTGDAVPISTLYRGLDVPNSMAFDSSGNLWVANFGNRTLVEYTHHHAGRGPAVPAETITSDGSGSLDSPAGLAVDAAGDLWVANDLSGTVVEYSKASLASGPVVPAVTISSDRSRSLSGPYALAFDSSGDLWVANYDNSTVVKYPKRALTSGRQVPAVTISADSSGSLNSPAGLAFDAAGDLWVSANLSNKVLEYTRRELLSGHLRPAVIISSTSWGSLNSPEGLAFDRAGNLWVANYGNDSVAEFGRSELSSSGSWLPSVIAGPGTELVSPGYIAITD